MRSLIIARRVVKQIVKDRRTLALLFVAPLLVIYLLYAFLNTGAIVPNVLCVGLPAGLEEAVAKEANATPADSLSGALSQLRDRSTDGVIAYDDPTVTVYVEGTDLSVTAAVQKAAVAAVGAYAQAAVQEAVQTQLKTILGRLSPSGTASAALSGEALTLPQTDTRVEYLNGSAQTTGFDDIAPLLMGFFIFFFVFLLAGVAFLRERNSGTLERLLASPVRRRQIVLGYFFGFGLVVFLQTLTIQLFVTHVLDVPLKGDFWLVTLTNLLLAAGSLSLGTLLSAFARNELQMFQFIPLVIVPQVLFCGLFSLRGAPDWVVWLSKAFPLTYAADALSNVALRGFGLSTVLPDLCMLTGYVLLFLLLNTLALKKYRRI